MKLFAGKPAECSMLALRPQETPGRQGSIIWSPARTKSTWNQILSDDMPRCWTSGEVSRRGTVGHYRVNNGRPGHTNGTGCALWSSANEVHGVVALCGPISSPRIPVAPQIGSVNNVVLSITDIYYALKYSVNNNQKQQPHNNTDWPCWIKV